MAGKVGVVYEANRADGGSLFYTELMASIKEYNRLHPDDPVSYRQVVMEGLGCKDSFTAKIKNGSYVPVKAKLEDCARYLGIRPETWDTYVRRYAVDQLNDPAVLDFFRLIAEMPNEVAGKFLRDCMLKEGKKVSKEAFSKLAA